MVCWSIVRKSHEGRQGRTNDVKCFASIMHWHIPTLSGILHIGKELAHKVRECKPTLRKHTCLSVLTEDDIFFLQRTRRPNARPLFALARHIKGEPALPLGVEHYEVHYAHRNHILVQCKCLSVRGRSHGRRDDIPVWGHGTVGRDRGVCRGLFEREVGREFAIHGAGESHAGIQSVYLHERMDWCLTLPLRASVRWRTTISG